MAYVTVTQFRDYMTQIAAGDEADAKIADVIDRAHDIVDDALGIAFAAWGEATTTKDVHTRASRCWLEIPYHEAESVTAVYAVSSRGATYESTDEVEDWLEEDDGRLYLDDGWSGGAWYRVTAIWGYGPAPNAVVEVELEAAINLWRGRDAGMWQNDVGVEGQGSAPFNRALSWAQRDVLNAVRAQYLGVVHA